MIARRLLAALAIGVALLVGAPPIFAAAAPSTPPPTPAGKTTGPASPTAGVDPTDDVVDDTPDTAPDNSRMLWVLGGAGVVAVAAAAVVIARR